MEFKPDYLYMFTTLFYPQVSISFHISSVTPPHLPFGPSGVDLVNHAWQDLRSGVPSLPAGEEAGLRWPVASNSSHLTRGSNCGACYYITPRSTGRTTHIHLWHWGLEACGKPVGSLFKRIVVMLFSDFIWPKIHDCFPKNTKSFKLISQLSNWHLMLMKNLCK